MTYTWTKREDYDIRVQAKDDHRVIGEWSDPFQISMAKQAPLIPN